MSLFIFTAFYVTVHFHGLSWSCGVTTAENQEQPHRCSSEFDVHQAVADTRDADLTRHRDVHFDIPFGNRVSFPDSAYSRWRQVSWTTCWTFTVMNQQ